MAKTGYKFEKQPQDVVLPEAKTLFMSIAEVNEVTGNYGGTLVFTEDQLSTPITFKEWRTNEKVKKPFKQGVDDLIDAYLEEYNAQAKKPVVRADKFKQATDKDGLALEGKFEFSCKNKEQPNVVDHDRTKLPNFDKLVGNGSTVKCQISLVPYVMQGKVGVTAYLKYVLLKDLIEYSADGGSNPFDDDDFDEDAPNFDEEVETEGADDADDY